MKTVNKILLHCSIHSLSFFGGGAKLSTFSSRILNTLPIEFIIQFQAMCVITHLALDSLLYLSHAWISQKQK